MKPAGRGFSTRPRGSRRGCIADPRSMHLAVGAGRERYINSGRLSGRSAPPAVVDEESIRTESRQSVEIDGIATPVHTEVYE